MTTVLAIGAHPDDVDAGMGGSIVRLADKGHDVHLLDLTDGEPTPFGDPETRMRERDTATSFLNVKSRTTLDLPNRYLLDIIDARKKVAEVIRRLKPEVLFLPYWEDAHPDHIQTVMICEAARFYAKLTKTDMQYEPWYTRNIYYYHWSHLNVHISPSFIIDISGEYHEQKALAVGAYQSQFRYSDEQWEGVVNKMEAISRYFGLLIGVEHGEPFASKEKIGICDIRDIIR